MSAAADLGGASAPAPAPAATPAPVAPAATSTPAPEAPAADTPDGPWPGWAGAGADSDGKSDAEFDSWVEKREAERSAAPEAEDPTPEWLRDPSSAAKPSATPAPKPKLAADAPAAAPDPTPSAAASTIKVKLGQEEREVSVEKIAKLFGLKPEIAAQADPAELARAYQKHWLSEQRASHGTDAIKTLQQFYADVQRAPRETLQSILAQAKAGMSFEDIALQTAAEGFERRNMSPEQRELADLRAQVQREAQDRQRVSAQIKAEAEERSINEFVSTLYSQIDAVLTEANLPADPYHRARIEHYLGREMQERGNEYKAMTGAADMRTRAASHVAAVQREFDEAAGQRFAKLGPEGFMKLWPDFYKAIGEHRIAQFKQRQQAQAPTQAARANADAGLAPRRAANAPRRTYDEVLRSWRD